jgi:hypothetical protein
MLCRAAGIARDADVSAAYATAMQLVEEDVNHDCNPTYCAITDLRAALDPDHEQDEDAVQSALGGPDGLDSRMEDRFGSFVINMQHAAFLLGAAYVFVAMSALAAPEQSGGGR